MAPTRTSPSPVRSQTMTELKRHLPKGAGGRLTRPSLMHFSVNRSRGRQPGAGELLAASAYGDMFKPQGDSSSSKAAPPSHSAKELTLRPAALGRTWGADGNSTLNFSQSSTLRRAGNSQSDTNLSATARLANFKAERCLTQCEILEQQAQTHHSFGQTTSTRSGFFAGTAGSKGGFGGLGDYEKEAEVFRQNLDAVDNLLETINRSTKDRAITPEEQKARERREAAARREAELRRARKLEAEARDPHRKVARRLETTRRFMQEEVAKMDVPMMKVSFGGHGGVEQVDMVDVRLLRARMQQINEVAHVDSLLELQRARERSAKLKSTGKSMMKSSNSSPALASSSPALANSTETEAIGSMSPSSQRDAMLAQRTLMQLSFARRATGARMQKQNLFLNTMVRRLKAMRSKPPEATLRTLEASLIRNAEDRERFALEGLDEDALSALRETLNGGPDQPESEVGSPASPSPAERQMVRSGVKFAQKRAQLDKAAQKRAQRRWLLARFAGSVFFLHRLVVRKRKATVLIVGFLQQLGEWSRVQHTVQKLIRNLKILQRSCRSFLATKRARCEIMSKEWQRVEDQNLASIMRMFSQQAIGEKLEELANDKSRAGAGRQNEFAKKAAMARLEQSPMIKLMKQASDNFDWRQYRIPPKARMEIIAKYYMVRMKKRVNGTKNLLSVVQTVVRSQRELVIFLQQFGADAEQQAADLAHLSVGYAEPVEREFWRLSEDTIFDLISLAVQPLRHKLPFQEHPANRDHPHNPFYRPALKVSTSEASASSPVHADDLSKVGVSRPNAVTRRSPKQNSLPRALAIKATAQEAPNLDDVLGNFTPRLIVPQSAGQAPASRRHMRGESRQTESRQKFGDSMQNFRVAKMGDSMQNFRPAGMSDSQQSFWRR